MAARLYGRNWLFAINAAALFVTSHGGAPQQIVAREPRERVSQVD